MSQEVIRAEKLSKQYQIGSTRKYDTLRDRLSTILKRKFQENKEKFWALNNLCFEITCGDVVGVIGHNGAGKSTLLKIMSKITAPTTGKITIHGRVGSLLEIGTGFHQELTGRENIFLNGAILGMKRSEIRNRFDSIVEFSEISQFIDTPVKHYSSGMYMRLAFAVAAHLNPEILLVDEVLAVGDTHFQNKCLGKMSDVAKDGRTVLFVSHNISAVQTLCKHTMVLEKGELVYYGDTPNGIAKYMRHIDTNNGIFDLTTVIRKTDKEKSKFHKVIISNSNLEPTPNILMGDSIIFELHYSCEPNLNDPEIVIGLYSSMAQRISQFSTKVAGYKVNTKNGEGVIRCCVKNLNLVQGRYFINIAMIDSLGTMQFDHISQAAAFNVVERDLYGSGKRIDPNGGACFFDQKWENA